MHQRTRIGTMLVAAALLAGTAVTGARAAGGGSDQRTVTVMTQNMYFGAGLLPLLQATDLGQLMVGVDGQYREMLASDVPGRVMAVARVVAAGQPDLLGLQEAALWATAPFTGGTPPPASAFTPAADFIGLLVADLASLGLTYTEVSHENGFGATAPALGASGPYWVSFQDRDAVLAHTGAGAKPMTFDNAQGHSFSTLLSYPTPGPLGTVTFTRGWNSVEVTWRDATFRFVDAHLEAYQDQIRDAQAAELAGAVSGSGMPVVLVGDLNSDAASTDAALSAAYTIMLDSGFTDPWVTRSGGGPSYTCCHDTLTSTDPLTQRIDFILTMGEVTPAGMSVVGTSLSDRTASGMWGSDHAGVRATLKIDTAA